MNNFRQISVMLAQRAEEIARYLLPNGKRQGSEWCTGSINGESGESLKVHLVGDKAGVWCDFATGEKGDLLDLWAIKRNSKISEALKEASHYLGISTPKFEAHSTLKFVKPILKNTSPVKQNSPTMDYLINERKLTSETIKAYKVGEAGHNIIFPYWREDELIFVKQLSLIRVNGKKQIVVEPNCEPCLFGWHLIPNNSRTITLCEGEIDAMSLYQYGFPALSVPFGGGGGNKQKWLEYEFDRLAIFDEINLCLDNDREGQTATLELIERLGRHRCRIVKLPYKDANECLQKRIIKEQIKKCFDEARTLDPEELRSASLYTEEVIEEFYPNTHTMLGYNPPWQYIQNKIIFRPNELSIWTGINGHGKSQLLGHIILSSMQQGARVCIASLEIKPKKLLKRLTRQAAGLAEPTPEYIRAILEWYEDKLWLFDLVGTAKSDRLLEVFLYAHQRYGIDVFVIDSFMKCGIDEEDFKAQKAFIEKICDFKNQYNCHVHIVVHPRKSNDETQMPSKLDCKGTGAITDLADNCFTVWRNKAKEEIAQMQLNGMSLDSRQSAKLEECDCILRCDKQRNGEWEGKTALWFDRQSFQYLGKPGHKAKQFVEFSVLNSK
ncbi:bifunctional DNA primase/helicase [Legionella qingyii]|uniref:Bifunctional DNA primase/helicase n=1 Tax=Legionella qingyii TaxID=2184757 RepID=A0A317U463_9GAMM|nr:toprim domain-containing protein [Legionella qingyii]PWY56058.1 bifunctional DNA primase/helicase [Legionella qingyii]RUR22061.1 toprim domain-containing protein [Legionella qingyii]RUR25641.1 toprim domain-containing protein [Legionella qingyii]